MPRERGNGTKKKERIAKLSERGKKTKKFLCQKIMMPGTVRDGSKERRGRGGLES